uniref:Uncharacterized protein n=1 Tax=Anguilla anguilla TaxID=7936 RepID=A0A0E9WDR8_ANGAN
MKLLKYWSRKSSPGPRKAKSRRYISLLVICATTSLLVILADTKPKART